MANFLNSAIGAIGKVLGAIPSPIASIGSGVLNFLGQKSANKTNTENVQATNESNERLLDKQNDFNMMMWNKENEYNSPAAQRQRLVDAGFNPLFYGLDGNGNASQLTSAAAQPLQSPHVDNPMQGLAAGLAQSARDAAEVENINANTEKLRAERDKTALETNIMDMMKDNQLDLLGSQIKLNLSSADLNGAQAKLASQSIAESVERINTMKEEISQKWKKLSIDEKHQKADQAYKEAMVELDKWFKEVSAGQAERQLASNLLNDVLGRTYTSKQIDLTKAQTHDIARDATLKEAQTEFTIAQTKTEDELRTPKQVATYVNAFVSAVTGAVQTVVVGKFLGSGRTVVSGFR